MKDDKHQLCNPIFGRNVSITTEILAGVMDNNIVQLRWLEYCLVSKDIIWYQKKELIFCKMRLCNSWINNKRLIQTRNNRLGLLFLGPTFGYSYKMLICRANWGKTPSICRISRTYEGVSQLLVRSKLCILLYCLNYEKERPLSNCRISRTLASGSQAVIILDYYSVTGFRMTCL